jgi:hypothetical protein
MDVVHLSAQLLSKSFLTRGKTDFSDLPVLNLLAVKQHNARAKRDNKHHDQHDPEPPEDSCSRQHSPTKIAKSANYQQFAT